MRFLSPKIALALAAACALPSLLASADTVVLKSGDTFTGTVTRMDPQIVDITTGFAGVIHVQRSTIKSIRTEAPVTVVAADGTQRNTFLAPAADGSGILESSVAVPVPPPAPPVAKAPAKVYNTDLEKYFLPIGPHWKNTFTLGAVNTTGNSSSTDVASELAFNYDNKPLELNFKIGGAYGNTNGSPSAQLFYLDIVGRRALPEWDPSGKWYVFGENHELYDGVKHISYRITNSIGAGYYFFNDDKFKLDLRAGPAYVCEQFFGDDHGAYSNISALVGLRAVYNFDDRTSISEEVIYTPSLEDMQVYQITSETALTIKLPEIARGMGLKFGFRDDYDNTAGKAGNKPNDTRLTLAVTFDF